MKLTALLILICIIACNKASQKVLSPKNLPSETITVVADRDSVYRTAKGATLTIKKGTFDSDTKLEIKEAYTMQDIVLGGLTTTSNGVPLRSGGMIYIGAEDGSDIQPKFPIGVEIPTNSIEEGMELFKGEVVGDSINWVNEDSLKNQNNLDCLENGKAFYINNCMTCHAINKNKTGPALASVRNRGPWRDNKSLHEWVRNPAMFIPRTSYTKDLQEQYGSIMPGFPQLEPEEIDCIINFIMNESGKSITDTFSREMTTDTSIENSSVCFGYSEPIQIAKSERFVDRPLQMPTIDTNTIVDNRDIITDTAYQQKLTNLGFTSYKFQIDALGWYNVDAILEESTESVESILVNCSENTIPDLEVLFFLPQQKVCVPGFRKTNSKFDFLKLYNKIPLIRGSKAIVLAFGSENEEIFWGTSTFELQNKIDINIMLKPGTPEGLKEAITKAGIDGIDLDLKKQVEVPCGNTKDSVAPTPGAPR